MLTAGNLVGANTQEFIPSNQGFLKAATVLLRKKGNTFIGLTKKHIILNNKLIKGIKH